MLRTLSDLRAFRRDPLALFQERGRSGEPLARLHLGMKPIYLVTEPSLVREVLRADEAVIGKGRHIAKLRQIVGWNSVTLSGPDQRQRRAAIHQAFMQGMGGDYVPQFAAVIRGWLATLSREPSIDAHLTTAHLTLRVICTVLFGPGALSSGDEAVLIQAIKLVEDDLAAEMFRVLPLTPWAALRKRRRLAQAREMMGLVVDRTCRRATAMSLLKALQDLGLDRDALRDEVLMILIAGHHTTGAAAAWMLAFIAADPDLARTLASEAARASDAGGEITPMSLRSAATSRALSYEVLRLYPSVHWFARDLVRDADLRGRHLKRGTTLVVCQWHLHRDPRHWSDPEAMRLDRSWTSNPAYIPFGFGGRACTGMAVATLMLQLIALEFAATFQAELADSAPLGPPRPSITLVPPPIRLRLAVRDGASAAGSEIAA